MYVKACAFVAVAVPQVTVTSTTPAAVVLDANVVAGGDDFIEPADVIAVLMPADHVIEPAGGRETDRLETGNDILRPLPCISRLQENGRAAGPLDQDRPSPADIDVVDFELLGREWKSDQEQNADRGKPRKLHAPF